MLAFAAARIGLQSGSLDSRNRTYLIIVRRIARNADGVTLDEVKSKTEAEFLVALKNA